MTTHKETLTLALEKAFELGKKFCEPTNSNYFHANVNGELARLIERTQEALAQPEQEPVAWRAWFDADNSAKWLFTLWPEEEHPSFDWQPLYTHPPVPTAQPKEPEQRNASEHLEPVAYVIEAKSLGAVALKLTKELPVGTQLYTTPPQRKPLTDEMVLAGARALAKRHADSCGLDFDDVWKYYAEEHKDDAKAVIEAADGIKE